MTQSIGALIRQLRREQNKTQTELGGMAFSKSYVSAVESNKLTPSKEALKHFALALGRSEEYFLAMANPASIKALLSLPETTTALGSDVIAQEKVTLLAAFLDQPDYTEVQTPEAFFSLDASLLAMLDFSDQAHYYFFQGLMLQKKEDYSAAIECLERARARENHTEHGVAILYEISKCYLQLHHPWLALHYTQRAQQAIDHAASFSARSSLPFQIELHSGYVCLALERYQHALEHFERARIHLSPKHPIQYAGRLYQGLGYCAYALACQQASISSEDQQQTELFYQQALTYLLQGLTIVQMAGDTAEANNLRLMLATLKLDWCTWRTRCYQRQKRANQPATGTGLAGLPSLLDEATEQCYQVLASFEKTEVADKNTFHERARLIYVALALLTRVKALCAFLAHAQGYENTFQRERSLACALCQQILDSCQDQAVLASLVWNVKNLAEQSTASSFAALPRLPENPARPGETALWPDSSSVAEAYFAAGEVAELLGQTTADPAFMRDCYSVADRCFLHSLALFKTSQIQHPDASGYLTRACQHYLALVEQRLFEEKNGEAEIDQVAHSLLVLCQQLCQPSPAP